MQPTSTIAILKKNFQLGVSSAGECQTHLPTCVNLHTSKCDIFFHILCTKYADFYSLLTFAFININKIVVLCKPFSQPFPVILATQLAYTSARLYWVVNRNAIKNIYCQLTEADIFQPTVVWGVCKSIYWRTFSQGVPSIWLLTRVSSRLSLNRVVCAS